MSMFSLDPVMILALRVVVASVVVDMLVLSCLRYACSMMNLGSERLFGYV